MFIVCADHFGADQRRPSGASSHSHLTAAHLLRERKRVGNLGCWALNIGIEALHGPSRYQTAEISDDPDLLRLHSSGRTEPDRALD